MKEHPLITVVIPVYNGSNYLSEAIDSVLAQTYPNIEIIVIDDGSTDNTWEIIQSYGEKIHGYHKENGGVSSALNVGIKNMHGEWFAWLSHDDIWLPENIERHLEHIAQYPGKGVYYGGYSYMNPQREIIYGTNGLWYPKGSDLRHMIRFGNYINGITVLISKQCFASVGFFNENLRYNQENELWFRIAQKYELSLLPKRLAMTRLHPNQIGNVRKNYCKLELSHTRNMLLSCTSPEELFPQLKDESLSRLKRFFLTHYSSLYIHYLHFCISTNLPSFRDGLFALSKKILPKSVVCKIVRKFDRGE